MRTVAHSCGVYTFGANAVPAACHANPVAVPIVVRALVPALHSIPPVILEAASTCGAGRLRRAVDVVVEDHDVVVPARGEMPSQGKAHDAESEESHVSCVHRQLRCAFTAGSSRGERAASRAPTADPARDATGRTS